MEGQGWGLPPTCQGQLCPVGKGSRIPGPWHPVGHWHSEQETSLWSHGGTGLGLTAQGQDPPACWPFLGDRIVRPHSPAADPRGLWPSPDPPHRWDHCLRPLPWLPVPLPHLLLPGTDAGKVCWERTNSTSVRRTGGTCGPPDWGQQGGKPLTLRCRNRPCAAGGHCEGGSARRWGIATLHLWIQVGCGKGQW